MFLFSAKNQIESDSIINKIYSLEKINIITYENLESFLELFLEKNFLKAIENDTNIIFILEEMSNLSSPFIESNSIKLKFDNLKLKNHELSIENSGFLDRQIASSVNFYNSLFSLWKRIYELLENFFNYYFEHLMLIYKKQIKEISLEIKNYIVEETRILYKFGKINHIYLLTEENELLYIQSQLTKINQEIAIIQNKMNLANFGYDNLEIIDIYNILKPYEENIRSLTKNLSFGVIDEDGIIYINMQDLEECRFHKKRYKSPLDLSLKGSEENVSFTTSVLIHNILIYPLNLIFNKKIKVLKYLKSKGSNQIKNQKAVLMQMDSNNINFNELLTVYFEALKKEIIKSKISTGSLLQIFQFIDRNILNILQNRIDSYIQKSKEQMNLLLPSLSAILTSFQQKNKNLNLNGINLNQKKENYPNPFKNDDNKE